MIFNRTEKEEKAYLMDIIALLAANIEQMDKAIEDKSKDVMEHKLYLWENLSELDRAEKSAVRQIVTQQVPCPELLYITACVRSPGGIIPPGLFCTICIQVSLSSRADGGLEKAEKVLYAIHAGTFCNF